ncbi:MAG: Biopolymer transport protein ExbB [Planctomycetota bacterium]|jgi:biopolymer transport protein ExbB
MILKQLTLGRGLAVVASLALSTVVFAQDAPAAAPAEEASGSVLGDMLANAGFIGYVIILMSVVSLALIIENFMSIKREKLAPPELVDELNALFEEQNYQQAIELCDQEKNYLTRVVGAGLAKMGHHFDTIQTGVREMETEESVKLFQKVGWLSLLSAIAPMMGLFGTVTGMFVTFGEIAAAGGSVSPAQLAGGIKLALVTTILGLTVAIPVGLFFFVLKNRVVRITTEVNALAEDFFERFRAKS